MRGTRQRRVEIDERDRGSRTRARRRATRVPATFQCTFSNVTQKTLARKRKLVARLTRCAPAAARGRRRASGARPSPATRRRAPSPASARRASVACRSRSARAIPSTSSGATTTPAPVSRISSAAAPSGGTSARIGRSAARYSKTLPESTPLPRPPASGIRSSSASESRCSSSERAPRRVRDQLEPVAEPLRLRPLAVGRAEVAEEARDDVVEARLLQRGQERPRVALAEERAGVRDPEASRSACTRCPRSRRSRSRSRSSRPRPFGSRSRISSAIASETATIASAWRATSRATACSPCSFARTSSRSASPVRVRDDASRAGRRPTARPSRA